MKIFPLFTAPLFNHRRTVQQRFWLFFLLWISSGLIFSYAQAAEQFPSVDQGWFVFSSTDSPPPASATWTPVHLPDNWNVSHPNQGGTGWYRFHIQGTYHDSELWGIYLPRLSVNAQLFINGQLVGSGGRFIEPVAHNSYRPLFFGFPGQLLHSGDNVIDIRLLGYANEGSGLSPFKIGRADALETDYQHQFSLQVIAPTISFVLLILLSLMLFIIWLRRRQETIYLMFSLCGGFSTLYTAAFFIQEVPWLTHSQWLWLIFSSAMWYVYCVMLLIHRFVKVHRPTLEKALLAYTITGPLIIGILPSNYRLELFGLLGLGFAVLSLYVLIIIFHYRHHCSRKETWLLFCSILFSAIMGYHDLINLLITQREVPIYYFYWGSTIVGIAIAFLLLLRFDQSLHLFEALNRDLHHLVEQKSRALNQSYQERQTLETRQAVFRERERIMRDLHDGLGGYLVSALVQAEKQPLQTFPLQQTLRAALNDLRLMIDSLDGDPIDLASQLGSLRDRLETGMDASGAQLHWLVTDSPHLPNPNASNNLQLMRMIQEIFTNIAKHSRAHHVYFCVAPNILEIKDDGVGFAVDSPHLGRGLPNLRLRAHELGISLHIDSSPSGTAIHLTW
ncbi:MAG: hypothetical protein G3H99_06795 [Ferrovum sp.]|nr:hypothetical protein [Ferrovum sp.]NDU87784.1 hypothetical protein [Ferrovum sp.]